MTFRGIEFDAKELKSDPLLPLHIPGMKFCLNVLATGRPNYLYISLDSIFRNTVFSEGNHVPDVFLYLDRHVSGESYSREMLEVASYFPIQGVFINKEHKGTVANYWTSFNRAFSDGYDFCMLLEEDWLITTKALQWIYDIPKIASHYSVYRWTDRMDHDDIKNYDHYCYDDQYNDTKYTILKQGMYLSWCMAYQRESFEFIYNIIKANGQWGLFNRNIVIPEIRRTSYIDWDRTIISILNFYGLLSMCPTKSFLAHFGCQTSNFMGYGSGVNRHEQMFSGDRSRWLDNVLEIFRQTNAEEKTFLHFYPLSFEYE